MEQERTGGKEREEEGRQGKTLEERKRYEMLKGKEEKRRKKRKQNRGGIREGRNK